MQMARSFVVMAVNAKQHHVQVVEHDDVLMYCWECLCRKVGVWVPTRAHAKDLGEQHIKRATPKQSGPKTLRALLNLDGGRS
jgi:hypothetical protein